MGELLNRIPRVCNSERPFLRWRRRNFEIDGVEAIISVSIKIPSLHIYGDLRTFRKSKLNGGPVFRSFVID